MSAAQPSTDGLSSKVGKTHVSGSLTEPPFLIPDLQQITLEGETWNVVNTGDTYQDRIYCRLSSVDKCLIGKRPIQKCVWVHKDLIKGN